MGVITGRWSSDYLLILVKWILILTSGSGPGIFVRPLAMGITGIRAPVRWSQGPGILVRPQALGITGIRAPVRWSPGGLISVMPHGWGHLHSINVITHLCCDLWGFQLPEVRKEKSKNCQIHICGFHCVAKHIIRWLKICTLFLVYSQIWLNLHTDDCHFFLQTEIPLKEKHWLTLLQLHSLKLQLLHWCTAAAGPLLLASHPTKPLLAAV